MAMERLSLLNHTSKPGYKHDKTQVKPSIFLSEIKEDVQWKNKEKQKMNGNCEERRLKKNSKREPLPLSGKGWESTIKPLVLEL
jgi:hypothetical protein